MSTEITKEQAIELAESGWWKLATPHDIVKFQLFTDRLCMPFGEFQKATEEALGRPVWTHEFVFVEQLRAEFLGDEAAPSFAEIIELIPSEKRIIVEASP